MRMSGFYGLLVFFIAAPAAAEYHSQEPLPDHLFEGTAYQRAYKFLDSHVFGRAFFHQDLECQTASLSDSILCARARYEAMADPSMGEKSAIDLFMESAHGRMGFQSEDLLAALGAHARQANTRSEIIEIVRYTLSAAATFANPKGAYDILIALLKNTNLLGKKTVIVVRAMHLFVPDFGDFETRDWDPAQMARELRILVGRQPNRSVQTELNIAIQLWEDLDYRKSASLDYRMVRYPLHSRCAASVRQFIQRLGRRGS